MMIDTVQRRSRPETERDSTCWTSTRTGGEEAANRSPESVVPRLYERLHACLRTAARSGQSGDTTEGKGEAAGFDGASAILAELVASLHDARGTTAGMAREPSHHSGNTAGGRSGGGETSQAVPALLVELHGAWLHAVGHVGPRCAPAPSEIVTS
jgi:hypothetical protein